ncbi:MAG: hypothetical protein ACRDT6_24270 [Micromonosporaceae bacterium]
MSGRCPGAGGIDEQLNDVRTDELEQGSHLLLELLEYPQQLYTQADDETRKLLNRACFTKLWIDTREDQPHIVNCETTSLIPAPQMVDLLTSYSPSSIDLTCF